MQKYRIEILLLHVRSVSSLNTLFLLLCCTACGLHTEGMEYSVKLSKCYDYKHGFDEHPNVSAAPIQATNNHVSSNNNGNDSSSRSNYNSQVADGLSINYTDAFQQQKLPALISAPATSTISGWKCCCWNATTQDEVECRCEGEALTRVPQTLTVPVQRLTIASAGLPRLRRTGLKVYAGSLLDVVLIDLKHLECIEDGTFASVKLLRTIYISHAPQLTFLSKDVFLGISDSIKIIRIINSGLIKVPNLMHLPPDNILQMIDLDNNHINRIDRKSLRVKTEQLILANNEIRFIDESAFYGSQIAILSLKDNRLLTEVHPNAFNGVSMQQLDLSSTSLVRLPSSGLRDIEQLRIENTHTLKTIPSIYNFENLQRAYLTHSFHCCAFKFPSRHDPRRHAERMKEIAEWQKQCIQPALGNTENTNLSVAQVKLLQRREEEARGRERQHNLQSSNDDGIFHSRSVRDHFEQNNTQDDGDGDEGAENGNDGEQFSSIESDYMSDSMIKEIGIFHEEITINPDSQLDEYCGNFTFRKHEVECYPMPNALNPCEDVMGYQWLRISVWVVLFLAVVGNVAVLVVILSIRSDSASVPRFLMCHLAFADLCLGLYLLLIASIDAHSMGEYFNYAYDWQYGAGCKLAGFLTVFASHLSVFTLTIITIERWLAITNALYLNKRIKLKPAAYIMVGGWIFSIAMSLLPLFGISNYSSTSICLPMEIRDPFDTVYLVSILGLNGVAFCIIAICYSQIYLSLGEETRQARNTHPGEMSIAKKMLLLVFTNFSCWAPIAFFGITALAGCPLINVTKSKILLVFFYPLNSCADPYLYAILTSQYRQDLSTLLSKFGICTQQALKYNDSVSQPVTTNFSVQFSSSQRKNSRSQQQHRSSTTKAPETQLMLEKQEDFV